MNIIIHIMSFKSKLSMMLLVLVANISMASAHEPIGMKSHSSSIEFIENKGQWIEDAKFKAKLPYGVMFLTNNGFVYNFVSAEDLNRINGIKCGFDEQMELSKEDGVVNFHAYRMNFVNANTEIKYEHGEKKPHYHNYFLGNDQSKWAGNVGLYASVTQKDIYNGVDVVLYGNEDAFMKYDLIVAPHADISQVSLSFEGVQPELTKDGSLLIKTSVNEIIEKAPYTYQEIDGKIIEVVSNYEIDAEGLITFAFPNGYNTNYPLIIDPELIFATYSGANDAAAYSYATTYDKSGSLYAGADSWGLGWPTTFGAFQDDFAGGAHDVGINKYTSDGSALIYSTYYGGQSADYPHAMIVNDQDELILVGNTVSNDLPVTSGAYNEALPGQRSIFVAHFNHLGTDLIGATYIGSNMEEPQSFSLTGTGSNLSGQNTTSPIEVNFDDQGNIWVVSNTPSPNFPTTANAFQPTFAGGIDGVIFQLDPTCSNLMYSSYIGGAGADGIFGIQFNSKGEIVICGATQSSDFPTSSGALHTTAPGGMDGFVTILDPNSGAIISSTYVGTNNVDQAVNLQIDCGDNVYVLGRTLGSYPISPGTYNLPNGDVFIDKLTPDLSTSLVSTRTGIDQSTSSRYFPTSFLLDICGNTYVAGLGARNSSLPVTPDSFVSQGRDFWFVTLEPNFSELFFASYYGSGNDHTHVGVNRMDPEGVVYHSVCSASPDWPVTPGVFGPIKGQTGGQDIVSFKFDFEAFTIDVEGVTGDGGNDPNIHAVRGCIPAYLEYSKEAGDSAVSVEYQIGGNAQLGVDYELIPNTGTIDFDPYQTEATLEIKPLLVANPSGPKYVVINTLSPCGCDDNSREQFISVDTVWIYDSLYVNINTPLDTICPNTEITIDAEMDGTLDFQWTPEHLINDVSGLTITAAPIMTTTFTITVTQPNAPSTCPPRSFSYQSYVEPYPQINIPEKYINTCPSDSIDVLVYVEPSDFNYIFKWSSADYLRSDDILNNKFFSTTVGEYPKTIEVYSPVAECYAVDSLTINVNPPFEIENVTPVDTLIEYGETVFLSAEGEANVWYWSPIDYLSDPNIKNPTSTPLESMEYTVIGFDQFGCTDTAIVSIDVEYESNVIIPNAFSPNGDGLNDVLSIQNLQFDKLAEFKVFNRLGQVVFETTNPSNGWDGHINSQPAPSGVYYYIVRIILPGAIEKTYKGDVTLIR